jgi:hypothetical protein
VLQYGCLNFHAKHGGQRAKLTVVVKNKWFGAWLQAWFYCKVPLIRVPSYGRGKGIFALHSYMSKLEFVMEPSYQCPNSEVGDLAFVKATHTIGGRDAILEYMACELFPLTASFDLVVILEGETPMSKLMVPLPEFPIARHPDKTNDGFQVRVEIATMNIVGRYTCGEHRVCIEVLPNGGWVNRVFEQADIPYEPRLEPGSEVCEEATNKRKNDAGIGPSVKHTKMSRWKVMPAKAFVAPKGMGVASSKMVLAKAPPGTHVSKGTSVPPKTFV